MQPAISPQVEFELPTAGASTLSFAKAMKGPTAEFRSEAFPKYPDEDGETVNPNRWGKRLAEYIRDKLPEYDLPTEGILCEDWGWLVSLKNDQFPLWIGCGPMEDPLMCDGPETEVQKRIAESPQCTGIGMVQFCVFIAAEPGFLRRLFSRVDTAPAVSRVADALRKIFDDSEIFVDVTWCDDRWS